MAPEKSATQLWREKWERQQKESDANNADSSSGQNRPAGGGRGEKAKAPEGEPAGALPSNVARGSQATLDRDGGEESRLDNSRVARGSQATLDRNASTPGEVTAREPIFSNAPPQNVEAEQALLGAVLLDNALLGEISRVITPSEFYRESHREIYKAMLRSRDAGNEIDAITLAHELRAANVLEAVGGGGYLAELAAAPPWVRHFARYAEIVKETAIKRDLIRGAAELLQSAYNGSSLVALGEQVKALTPQQMTQGGTAPILIKGEIEMMSGIEFAAQQQAQTREWLVRALLARREISLWSGKVEAGKTTLLRTLVMCVARQLEFLGRWTARSRVLYVMLDGDGAGVTYDEFKQLGWSPADDPIHFIVDPVMAIRPNSFEQFHAKLLELTPGLVVIDPLGRFQKVDDFLSYDITYAMARFSELARQTNSHFALLHHIPRGRLDSDDVATAAFGSVAIAGGCNARFVCRRNQGGIYTIASSKGKGGGFEPLDGEIALQMDETTHWVTTRGPVTWKDKADAIQPRILEIINESDESWTAQQLGQQAGVQRSIAGAAAKSLYKAGSIAMTITKANRHLFKRKDGQGVLVG